MRIFENIKDEIIGNFNIIRNARHNAMTVGQVEFCLESMDTQLNILKARAEQNPDDVCAQTVTRAVEYWRNEMGKAVERKLL